MAPTAGRAGHDSRATTGAPTASTHGLTTRRRGSTPVIIMLILVATCAWPSGGRAAVTSAQAIAWLNTQRSANGIPGDLTDNAAWDTGCAHHIAWEEQNPNAANPHIETPGTPGYTDDGANAGANAVLAWGDTWTASDQYPWGAENPWETAPIHLMQLLGPDLAQTGWADDGSHVCMITWAGYGRPAPATPELLTYPANGTSFIYASETANEWPFTPAAFVGLPQGGTTGPYLYVLGYGTGRGAITAASLNGPSGSVPVRTVDDTTTGSAGDLGSYLPPGGMIIPVHPLTPGATYTASVTFTPGSSDYSSGAPAQGPLSLTWSFTTALPANDVSVDASIRGGTVQFSVSSSAANPQLVVTGPRRLTPRVDRNGEASVPLGPGLWTACASSGGPGTGYAYAHGCTTVNMPGLPGLRLSGLRSTRGQRSVVVSAAAGAVGQRVTAVVRYFAWRCMLRFLAPGQGVDYCEYDRLAHITRRSSVLRSRQTLILNRGWLTADRRVEVTVTTRRFIRDGIRYAGGEADRNYCTARSCAGTASG